jgi:hypothetical protein
MEAVSPSRRCIMPEHSARWKTSLRTAFDVFGVLLAVTERIAQHHHPS